MHRISSEMRNIARDSANWKTSMTAESQTKPKAYGAINSWTVSTEWPHKHSKSVNINKIFIVMVDGSFFKLLRLR